MPGPTGVILVSRAQLAAENEADWEGEESHGGSVTEGALERDLPAEDCMQEFEYHQDDEEEDESEWEEHVPTREEEDEYFALCARARSLITELVSLDTERPLDRTGRKGMFRLLRDIRRSVVWELRDVAGDMIHLASHWPYSKVSNFCRIRMTGEGSLGER